MQFYDFCPSKMIKIRASRGWSQSDLAKRSGVAAGQISRYEAGNSNPRPHVIAKLASALGVDEDELTTASDQTPLFSEELLSPLHARIPNELMEKLQESAINNGRSVNAEVASRLEASFAPPVNNLNTSIKVLEQIMAEREARMLSEVEERVKALLKGNAQKD